MLAFSTAPDGWNAALELQRFFAAQSEAIDLRISIHSGPCLAVTFNTGIDYFGQTVNIAAKLQLLAEKQQIVFSDSIWQAVRDQLDGEHIAVESVQLKHPTLPQAIPAYRAQVQASLRARQIV